MGVGGISGSANSIANMMEQNAKTDAQQFQDTIQQEKIAEEITGDELVEQNMGSIAAFAGSIAMGDLERAKKEMKEQNNS